jgi:tRNA U34 5-carboxymethylaminomethyl modifying GTPase MnmE/TrmE
LRKLNILQEESNKEAIQNNKSKKKVAIINKCDHRSKYEQNGLTTSGDDNLPASQKYSVELTHLIRLAVHILQVVSSSGGQ